MTEQTERPPIPDNANFDAIASHLIGPQRFGETLELQGWILAMLAGGFAPACDPEINASGQRVLTFDDTSGSVRATVEYGRQWTARTLLQAPSRAPESESWWAASSGLIPAPVILAAAGTTAPATAQVGKLLEAAGWGHASRYMRSDGLAVALDVWTDPLGNCSAARRDEGLDRGWILAFGHVRRTTTITASLDTPPGVIAALASA